MKKCLPFISGLLFLTKVLFAQAPVFNSGFYPPFDTSISQPAYSYEVSIGDTGANQVWDYSSLIDSGTVVVGYYPLINASGTQYANLYNAANLVTIIGNGYDYYTINSQLCENDGEVEPNGINEYFDTSVAEEPEIYFEYPFTYGTKFINNFYYDYYTAVNNRPVATYLYGTDTFNADGYGTLKLPNGHEFNNILRVSYSNEVVFPYNGDTSFDYTKLLSYYSPSYPNEALLNITYNLTIELGDTSATWNISYYPNSSTAINDINLLVNNLNVFPNPAYSQATLALSLQDGANINVYVTNIIGQRVKTIATAQANAGENTYTIETGDMAKGLYLVTVEVNGAIAGVRKLEIE